MFFVYMTTNLVNDKKYIGQHDGELNDSYLGSGTLLKQAIQKYGREHFKREILETCPCKEDVDLAEKKWITFYDAVNNENFYNIHEGGTGGNTYQGLSKEELQRIKDLKRAQSVGKNNPMYGKHMSEESKEKIRRTFEANGVSQGKNNPMYGRLGADNPNSILIYAVIDGEKKYFSGVREAARSLKIHAPNISRSLTSHGRFSAGKSATGKRIYWFYNEGEQNGNQ